MNITNSINLSSNLTSKNLCLIRKYQNIFCDNSMDHLLCKICLQIYFEPYSITCGHTFCKECIVRHLNKSSICPICGFVSNDLKIKLVPNYTVSALIEKILLTTEGNKIDNMTQDKKDEKIWEMFKKTENCKLENSKRKLSNESQRQSDDLNKFFLQNMLFQNFLINLTIKKKKLLIALQNQLNLLNDYKDKVTHSLDNFNECLPSTSYNLSQSVASEKNLQTLNNFSLQNNFNTENNLNMNTKLDEEKKDLQQLIEKYCKRLNSHMNSLESAFFKTHDSEKLFSDTCMEIDEFLPIIKGMTQYDNIKKLSTLQYNVEASAPMSIVSSIEFDKDGDFFVVAGITKLIKLYDYNTAINYKGKNPFPIDQLQANAKISNVSFNPYHKNLMASSDYDGSVQLWDTNKSKVIKTFREHEKRCWSVQFNNVDSNLMASGSDDFKVKLWNINAPSSVCTMDVKANVCAVHFSPKSRNYLVFGSADHFVYLYDIRFLSQPLAIFSNHQKAVSYVKFCTESEIISASTDGDLRLWDINTFQCLQTLHGHLNERNFVGLATNGNHVICGSENNRLYLYYKNVSEPVMYFDFETSSVQEEDVVEKRKKMFPNISTNLTVPQRKQKRPNNPPEFISAVCWKKNSNVVLAANSQGTTHILELN